MNGDRPVPPDDTERDAWLRTALRHAPDASADAPPALGEAILREAGMKARTAAGARRSQGTAWWSAAWAWLARPSVGAAFAGIVVATTVGLLWHDTPLPEAPRPDTRVATAPPAAPAPSQTQAAQDAAVAPAPPAVAQAPVGKPAPAPPAAKSEAPSAARAPTMLGKRRAPAADAVPNVADGNESMSAPTGPPVASTDAGAAPAAAGTAPSPPREQRFAVAAPAFSLADVRSAVAADPAAWTWQRGGSAAQPVGDALTAWLATLDAATGRRWQRADATSAAAPPGDEVVLLHHGRIAHRLHLEGARMRWDTVAPNGATQGWQAPLVPGDARALQSRLDEATR